MVPWSPDSELLSAVQRATRIPSVWSWAQILATP